VHKHSSLSINSSAREGSLFQEISSLIIGMGVQKLTGKNLKVVWPSFQFSNYKCGHAIHEHLRTHLQM